MNAERIANRWVHPVWHILGQFLRPVDERTLKGILLLLACCTQEESV
jgi:hypothetical protein